MAVSVPVIDMADDPKPLKTDGHDQHKGQKRKRSSLVSETLSGEQRESRIKELNQEMEGLFGCYREMMERKSGFGMGHDIGSVDSGCALNSVVAVLMEESDLPLAKLVDAIHEKVKDRMRKVSLAAVKNYVLLVGRRVKYGLNNEEADILEDDSHSSLWCWEIRDAKLIPKAERVTIKARRTCRRKINERITAISAMITLLQKPSEKLAKVLNEADIHLLMSSMLQKTGAEMAEKEANREEKLLIKQLERTKREMEKEKKIVDRELRREKLQNDEAKKDGKRREREEAEMRTKLPKQQEEAERDQRRREKEEAELKKKLSIQKQASVMERFLKKCKTSPCQIEEMTKPTAYSPSTKKNENVPETITLSMDRALSSKAANIDDFRKLHLSSWHHLGHCLRLNQNLCWGLRMKPKRELFKELKLTANKGLSHDDLSAERLADGWQEQHSVDKSCHNDADVSVHDVKKCCVRKQLLQFDKSNRPAFYGIWAKKSNVAGPRCPWRKDPDLDYDVDSDEEWEEEEPGESLSDCDKDEEEGSCEGCSKAEDEDDSDDGFFVPDGYLSENEGVEVDRMESDVPVVDTQTSILTCLQTLSMRAYPFGPSVEISIDSMEHENHEVCMSSGKAGATPALSVVPIPDSDLPLIVKKEILVKLGMPISPEKGGGHTKSIAAFFSKRCLPPADKSSSSPPIETSPPQLLKSGFASQEQQGCT
ncbi:hypothetical protein V6N13_137610 [Hibiscus sabdariffa]